MCGMKRIISLLLTVALLLGLLSSVVLADDVTGSGSATAETTAAEAGISKEYRSWTTDDARWADLTIGTSTNTIRRKGSLIVALTKLIIQAGLKDEESFNVATYLEMLNNAKAFEGDTANLYWGKSASLIPGLSYGGFILSGSFPVEEKYDQLLTWIKEGRHLIIAIENSKDVTHYFAVDEMMTLATGVIYVMDSDSSTGNEFYVRIEDVGDTITAVNYYTGGTNHAHVFETTIIEPTCEDIGYTKYICYCGEGYFDSATEPLGHVKTLDGVTKQPTCTEEGVIQYVCSRCNAVLEPESIPALGHDYKTTVTAPTCTTDGYTTYTCQRSGCGYSIKDDIVSALGHELTAVVTKATCTTGGYTTYTCQRSGCTYVAQDDFTAATGHHHVATVVAPNCGNQGYTEHVCACGDSYLSDYTPATGDHTWDDGVLTTSMTDTRDGVVTWTCSVCHQTKTVTLPAGGSPYIDVQNSSRYYYAPVLWAATAGITRGTNTFTFSPDARCTREQVVTFLWRAAGSPEPTITAAQTGFTDLPSSSSSYYKAILWGYETGIVRGMSPTTFGFGQNVTRAQFVTFLWRFAGSPEPTITGASTGFTDLPVPASSYYKAILWAAENGVTDGTTPTTFAPSDYCTRGQVVTFLYRYCYLGKGKS